MADHGSIAVAPRTSANAVGQLQPIYPALPRVVRCFGVDPSAERLAIDAGRNDTEGSPAPPCLHLPRGGAIRIRVPVDAGARTIKVQAKQPSATLPRPTARILPNASIGLLFEVSATAPTGAGWVTIGPLAFTATAAGGVFLELTAPWAGGESGCWFDAVSVK